jgi:cytochrome c-type biogenesis protein CcmF
MEEIKYVGEHLLPGEIGQIAIVVAFVSSMLASVAYFFATERRGKEEEKGWLQIGRLSFLTHGLAVYSVIGIIFYLMLSQYFEYQYVQAHVSEDLPTKYIFSAFWEGQEGSFMLWMFWHIFLGVILMLTAKKWEAPTLSVLSLIQVFISSMLLGIYIGFGDDPTKLGSNPLMLLREVVDAPIFASADYLSQIKGTGLNPLLQNYWNTIHPPTLFLGFASTAIPFCYAIAGLWTRDHKAWLKPALRWGLFSGFILGTGILMGGAWAYEALSFGGYWAWDPVENMSLVPWLILIAGIHTNLIANATGHSIRSTYIFYLLTFIFIVYSTFLTRSGVLGDTSVHAFTEMGLEWQLVAFIATFLILSIIALASRYKGVYSPEKEEPAASKEFWMFLGSLVLLFSALIITASTSLPVYNKIREFFNPTFAGQVITDPIPHYNKYQLWIAVLIGLLSGAAQYLRYRENNFSKYARKFWTHLAISGVLTAALSLLAAQWINIVSWQYGVLLFFGIFITITNLDYLITFIKGNPKLSGSAISHIGFGLMIVGILASGLNKRTISNNPFIMEGLIEGASNEQLRKNVLLFKGSPLIMDDYEVTYVSDTVDTYTRTFTVNYKKKNKEGEVVEEFDLYPNILYDKSFTKVAASNPSTKRYFNRDIFTHIASLPQVEIDMDFKKQREDSLNYKPYETIIGTPVTFLDTVPIRDLDTFVVKEYRAEILNINKNPSHPDYHPEKGDIPIGLDMQIQRMDEDSIYTIQPVLVIRGQLLYSYPAQINEISTKVRLNEAIFDVIFGAELDMKYETFTFKQGDVVRFKDYDIQFAGFNKEPVHPNYIEEEGDIAVSAIINVQQEGSEAKVAQPLYLIRGSQQFNLKDQLTAYKLHFLFTGIDPATETVEIKVAHMGSASQPLPFEVATDSLRSDYIVLEAIEFPGINYFWLGSVMMMIGLLVSMFHRMSQRSRQLAQA